MVHSSMMNPYNLKNNNAITTKSSNNNGVHFSDNSLSLVDVPKTPPPNSEKVAVRIVKDDDTLICRRKKFKLVVRRSESTRKKRSPRRYSPDSPNSYTTITTTNSNNNTNHNTTNNVTNPNHKRSSNNKSKNNNNNKIINQKFKSKSNALLKHKLQIDIPPNNKLNNTAPLVQHSPAVFSVGSPTCGMMMSPLSTSSKLVDELDFEIAQKARYDPSAWQNKQKIDIPECRKNILSQKEIDKILKEEENKAEAMKHLSDEYVFLQHFETFEHHAKREEEILQRQHKKRSRTEVDNNSNNEHTVALVTEKKKEDSTSLLQRDINDKPVVPTGLSCHAKFNYNAMNINKRKRKWSQPKHLIWYTKDLDRLTEIENRLQAVREANLAKSPPSTPIISSVKKRKKSISRSATISPRQPTLIQTIHQNEQDPTEALRRRKQELLEQLKRLRSE